MIFLSLLLARGIVGLITALLVDRDREAMALGGAGAAFLVGGVAAGIAEREVAAHDLPALAAGVAAAVLFCVAVKVKELAVGGHFLGERAAGLVTRARCRLHRAR